MRHPGRTFATVNPANGRLLTRIAGGAGAKTSTLRLLLHGGLSRGPLEPVQRRPNGKNLLLRLADLVEAKLR